MFTALTQWLWRLRASVRSRDDDRDFEQELASHLEMLADDNLRRGMTPDEAQREARVRMGALASIQEQHRSIRGFPAVDAIVKDVRFAFRLIGRERGFSAAVIIALALGIGVNATGFTIVNAAFLRGLPFDDGRLYMLSWQTRSGDRSTVSDADLREWRDRSRAFAGMAGFNGEPVNISDDRAWPAEIRGAQITANAFGLLSQQPFLGRDFAPGDERKGAQPVAIIGYDLWKSRYGANRHVLGTTIRVNGQPASIIGVMPDGMKFPENAEVWVPFIPTAAQEHGPRGARRQVAPQGRPAGPDPPAGARRRRR